MTRAFIWDLDGTLLDSYDAILAGIEETYTHYGLDFDREGIHAYILRHSVQKLLETVAVEKGLNAEEMNRFRGQSLQEKNAQIELMDGAKTILAWAQEAGIQQFVYTHKGDNAFTILRDLGLESYFTEILTSQSGFVRKPSPEAANYLIDKYQLNPDNTYYIGDRALDVEFAQNSGIQSINFLESIYEGNYRIQALADIPYIFEGK